MTVPTPERQKIQGLEGLRALMAWWVIFAHLALALNLQLGLITRNTLAVDVFIILSGFVITLLIETKAEAYLPFIIRRAFRIFPLYLVVLVVSAMLLRVYASAYSNAPFTSPMNVIRLQLTGEALADFWPHFLVHVALLQGLVPARYLGDAAFTIVGQAWSVSMEWQFYLLAPFMMLALRRKAWLALILGVMILFLVKGYFSGGFIGQKALYFALGVSSYLCRKKKVIPMIIGIAAIASYGLAAAIPIAIWAVAFVSSTRSNVVSRLLAHPVLIYLGERSYSSYLLHMIPLGIGMFVLNRFGLNKDSYALVLIFGTVLFTAVISHMTFRWIEKPGQRLGAKLSTAWFARPSPSKPFALGS